MPYTDTFYLVSTTANNLYIIIATFADDKSFVGKMEKNEGYRINFVHINSFYSSNENFK